MELHDVDKYKQAQPYHVNKVPIPGGGFKGEMVFRFEMALPATEQHHAQDNSSHADMESVETGQHKKGGTVNACTQGQTHFSIGFMVFCCLAKDEQES